MFILPAEPILQQLAFHCRAYILELIGGVLMSDKSGNIIHLMYLPLLVGLERVGRYGWGSTCLAHMYREMCKTIYPSSKKWKDVECCCSLGYGISCHSFNPGLSTNCCYIHFQLGK